MSQSLIRVDVVYAPAPGQLDVSSLQLPAGSTLSQALDASGLLQRQPQAAGLPTGIWGRKQPAATPLRDGDRVELYRPLQCDPKEARRLRYRQRADKAKAIEREPAGADSAGHFKPPT